MTNITDKDEKQFRHVLRQAFVLNGLLIDVLMFISYLALLFICIFIYLASSMSFVVFLMFMCLFFFGFVLKFITMQLGQKLLFQIINRREDAADKTEKKIHLLDVIGYWTLASCFIQVVVFMVHYIN